MSNAKRWLELGLNTPNLVGKERGRKGTYGKANSFWKDKWVPRRIDGR